MSVNIIRGLNKFLKKHKHIFKLLCNIDHESKQFVVIKESCSMKVR